MKLERELPCIDVVELVTAYLERRLAPHDTERFEEHLAFCDGCSTYLEQMRSTIEASGTIRDETLPEELEQKLLQAFRGWKNA